MTAFEKPRARDAARRQGAFANGESVGMFVDGSLVSAGTVVFHERNSVAELVLFCVHRKWRKGGIGRRTANALLAFVRSGGAIYNMRPPIVGKHGHTLRRFVLNADDNSGAIGFWSSVGFKPQKHPYVDGHYSNTTPMVLQERGR